MSEIQLDDGAVLRAVSRKYYDSLQGKRLADAANKAIGQFYTPYWMATAIADSIVSLVDLNRDTISVLDPFCGDGRMLEAVVQRVMEVRPSGLRKLQVIGFDIDPRAIEDARIKLAGLRTTFDVSVDLQTADSFAEAHEFALNADICITNPPWLALKAGRTNDSAHLQAYIDLLLQTFPSGKSDGAFAGRSASLSRLGAVVSLESVNGSGVAGIVLPASILSDHASSSFREEVLLNFEVVRVETFSAELRVFEKVDQDCCWLVLRRASSTRGPVVVNQSFASGKKYSTTYSDKQFLSLLGPGLSFPDLAGSEALDLLREVRAFTPLGGHPGVKIFREIDETRIAEKFSDAGTVRFIKGRNVQRYSTVDPQLPTLDDAHAKRFRSLNEPKLIWRDVARRSQLRRMHGTVVGPGVIAGNSLGCLQAEVMGSKAIYYYLGIINSWVTELQVRALTSTNHVSAGVIKRVSAPVFDKSSALHSEIATLAERMHNGEDEMKLQSRLEALVLDAFGLEGSATQVIQTGLGR